MSRISVIVSCLFGVLLIAGTALLFGVISPSRGHDSARPPCEQLPDRQSVGDAMTEHEELVSRIEKVGPGVTVEVATPCEAQPDRAIVRIKYGTDTERQAVDAILRQEGFGVAVELVSK